MKVSQLRHLVEGMNPDDELMVLFWEKPEVFWNEETELTNEGWSSIVKEFEDWDGLTKTSAIGLPTPSLNTQPRLSLTLITVRLNA